MKPKTPMMKALVGKQGNLPQHLQDKIKAAPESPAKSYGSKTKSPVMQKETKGKKKFGEASAETREKQSVGQRDVQRGSGGQRKGKIGGVTVKAKVGKERGATDLLEVGKDTYKAAKKYVKGKLGISKMENNSPVKKNGKKYPSGINNNKPLTPAQKARIKEQQAQMDKRRKEGKRGTGLLNPNAPTPKQRKSLKSRGKSRKSPVMQQDLKKKDTKGKTKLPKLVVNTPKGPKAPRGPQRGSIGGVNVSIQTKERSTKKTDLLEVGKKYYKKAKKYVKSKMN
jgi:hypothetical protein